MNYMITIVQIIDPHGNDEHFLKLTDKNTGRTLSNEEYEEWLEMIGAECIHRF